MQRAALPARDRPLLVVLAAVAAGIVADRYGGPEVEYWLGLCALALLTAIWLGRRKRPGCVWCVLLAVAALAGLWHHDRHHFYSRHHIVRYCQDRPRPLLVRLVALDAPRVRGADDDGPLSTMAHGETTRLEVRVQAVRGATGWQRATGRSVLVVAGNLASWGILRGDQLEVAAHLVRVRGALNPGEPDFQGMCRARRQPAMLLCDHASCVKRLGRGSVWSPLRQLSRWRVAAESALWEQVGPGRAPLAAALLLGSREQLDQPTIDALFFTGTLHLLAISGLHVGILATVFWGLLRLGWVPRHRLLWATCLWIGGYALLTGARPPVVRAACLVMLYCLARGLRRPHQAWNALAAAALVSLAWRPAGLFDTGTQLSFLAVATLLGAWPLVAQASPRPPLERLLAAARPLWVRGLWAATHHAATLLRVSLVVWLVSLPLVALRFHMVAPLGIVLNVLLWPPLTVALFLALLTVITSPLPWLPSLFGNLCDKVLALIELTASSAVRWDAGHSAAVGPPVWWVVVFYAGLLAAWCLLPLGLPRRWWWALLSLWLAVAVLAGPAGRAMHYGCGPQPFRMSFVAVGHGTAVLLELPSGQVMLYDAGRMGRPRAAALPIASVLWARRIQHIDAIVLSHADADHFNAVGQLLERFSVGIVYVPSGMFRSGDPAVAALRRVIQDAQVPIANLAEGQVWDDGQAVRIEVLHPPGGVGEREYAEQSQGDNARSVVLLLQSDRVRCLLTGDLEGPGLQELLADDVPPVDVLLAPHHGSRGSQPAQLVRWGRPAVVVISAGANLAPGALQQYAELGADVRWTERDGMIEVTCRPQGVQVSSWCALRTADPLLPLALHESAPSAERQGTAVFLWWLLQPLGR